MDVAGAYDGEDHEPGAFVYLDERHAWELQRRRKVRVCTAEKFEAVPKAEEAAGSRPRFVAAHLDGHAAVRGDWAGTLPQLAQSRSG